jgi:adenosylcobinamide-phosphate synthase
VGLLALLLALLIEQARPLRAGHWVDLQFAWIADWVRQHTDAGTRGHGLMGWCVLVGVSIVTVGLVHWGLGRLHATTQFVFDVLVLYGTIGFRRFSQAFSEIQVALAAGDTAGARESLTRWIRELDPAFVASTAPVSEVCRVAIAHALVAAHRHVFAPIFWYLVLPGPIGPVLYRAVETLSQRWGDPRGGEAYGHFAVQAYRVLDWLPLRLTAAGFAVVGNFEDAAYCWRGARSRQSAGGADPQRALVLAAGGGAIGVRVADPELEADWARSELGFDWTGAVADPSALRSAVGLVWRAVVLWLAFFGIVTVSSWVG